jgi:hypothetical protein
MSRDSLRHLPDWPRYLDATLLTAYTGMTEAHFAAHLGVPPLRFGRRKVYDRKLVDARMDELAGLAPARVEGGDWTEAFG